VDVKDLLNVFIIKGVDWVESQRKAHRGLGRILTREERSALGPFFPSQTLDLARVTFVPRLENPSFYGALPQGNLPPLLDFSMASGMTFQDTIVISERYQGGRSEWHPLLFHELVHVVQYGNLGVKGFIATYVMGWAANGFDYYAVPLEAHAFELQRRFEADPIQGFSVEAEVERSLGRA
jgi:hypothetical protein